MSIEKQLEELVAAINDNTATQKLLIAAIKTAGATGSAAEAPAADADAKPARSGRTSSRSSKGAEKEVTVTEDDVAAAFKKIQEEVGKPEAKAAVKEFGYDRLADIPEGSRAEAVKFATKKLKELLETKEDDSEDCDDDL